MSTADSSMFISLLYVFFVYVSCRWRIIRKYRRVWDSGHSLRERHKLVRSWYDLFIIAFVLYSLLKNAEIFSSSLIELQTIVSTSSQDVIERAHEDVLIRVGTLVSIALKQIQLNWFGLFSSFLASLSFAVKGWHRQPMLIYSARLWETHFYFFWKRLVSTQRS